MRAFCLLFLLFASPLQAVCLDGIAAVVNQSIITKRELAEQVKLAEKQTEVRLASDAKLLEKQVLEQLIQNEVQLQLAKKMGIDADELEVDEALEAMAARQGAGLAQVRQAAEEAGLSFEAFRKNIRSQLIISQLQQRELLSAVHVSDYEAKQFLHSPTGLGSLRLAYHLKHILVPLPDMPSPALVQQAQVRANHIIEKLRQGEPFAKVALKEASGGQALNGGDLGWLKLPEMPTIFVKVVPHLQPGDIPDPIRSPSGFHIIQLAEKREAPAPSPLIQKMLARHILITNNALVSDEEAKHRLLMIKQKIQEGEDFAELAKAYSNDIRSASKGGSMGWITEEALLPEFARQLSKLPVKKLSAPFKTLFGWHLAEVLERKTETEDESTLLEKAKMMIQQRKFEEKRQAWVRQLQDEAFVKIEYPV